ncbi:MAG: PIG-L deacetylase family protein [Dehalococcoidia bacterium]
MEGSDNSVLVITAHPDDAEIGAGGTLARWVAEGRELNYVVCTNGDKGSGDFDMVPERLAQVRRQEQLAAAAALGVKEVVFLDYPDGSLEDTPEFRGRLVRAIRRFRPHTVVSTDPYRKYIWHRDHRITGRVVLDAIFPYARDHLSYPELMKEGLLPHKVKEVYLWAAEEPNTFIDINDTLATKLAALACHVSQVGSDTVGLEERMRSRASLLGESQGILAEAFHRVEILR